MPDLTTLGPYAAAIAGLLALLALVRQWATTSQARRREGIREAARAEEARLAAEAARLQGQAEVVREAAATEREAGRVEVETATTATEVSEMAAKRRRERGW